MYEKENILGNISVHRVSKTIVSESPIEIENGEASFRFMCAVFLSFDISGSENYIGEHTRHEDRKL